ncbi:hypothetical protein BDB01DRAFT_834985 [Pilobolus umbonatus]|nr:hypothetical protein BDB01DRAFT_834985 [Pilobolus umbonatus]
MQDTKTETVVTEPEVEAEKERPVDSTITPPNEEKVSSASKDAFIAEINAKRDLLRRLDEDLLCYRHKNSNLRESMRSMQERMATRQKDQQQLKDNFNEHLKSRRATVDDVSTIHAKLKELKVMIRSLSLQLMIYCDPVVATNALSGFWINLHESIQQLGNPIPNHRLLILTEKFLMDVLMHSMNFNSFSGLKISSCYTHLQNWFDRYDPHFCTRLRQEVAKTVVQSDVPNTDVHMEITKLNNRMYMSLWNSLLKAFPFIETQDAEEKDPNKHYATMLRKMVDHSSKIGFAMRGQEVEIAATAVGEGSEPIDTKTMVDEDGQTTGIIQFCICPPFIAYGPRIEILEKARVLCYPTTNEV